MNKRTKFISLVAILILIFISLPLVPAVSAQPPEPGSKISSLLAAQVEGKVRAVEAGGVTEALEEGAVDILQAMGTEVEDLNRQRIFIHLAQEPSQSQVEELEAMGLTLYLDSWIPPVGAHPTGFIIADMPVDKLSDLASKDYVVRLDSAEQFLEPQNDLATQKINADDVWGLSYDGTGIKIAVLDSGLDVTHNDIPTPIASKDYSNYPTLDETIANAVTGHGTHVTGSALGRGTQSSGVYKGSAPGAGLIFLKIGNDTDSRAPIDAMVNAIKDAVDVYNADIITMSYGGWGAYHDGTRQSSQAADYAVSQGAVFFSSAGNKADNNEHYSGTVTANSTTGFIQVNVTGAGPTDTFLWFNLVWFDGLGVNNILTGQFFDSAYTPINTINDPQTESTRGTEARWSSYGPDPFTIYYTSSGTYYFQVTNTSDASQDYHIYVFYAGAGSVTFQTPDPNYTIDSPADADSAIAVGSYNTRQYWWDYANVAMWYPNDPVDQISTFSSRGPRVDTGAPPKPNIVAPGLGIISARDNDVYPWPSGANTSFIDNDGPNENNTTKNDGNGPADYYMMQGTSMASPMAAGAAALLLEAQPGLKGNPTAVRDRLQQTASKASSPDNIWGYGLIDIYQAVAGAATILPDLIIESLTHSPANPTTADTITFTAVVKNIGNAAAGASTLEFRVGGEFPYPTYPIPALNPGASYTVQRQEVLTVAQNYLNTATADINNEVSESDETNNQKTDSYTVLPPGVVTATATRDIAVQTLSPGASTNVTVTINNAQLQALGLDENPPAGWTVAEVDNGGATIYQATQIEWFWMQAAAGTITVVYNLTVPLGTADGTYAISGTLVTSEGTVDVGGDNTISVGFGILAYYRGLGNDPNVVELSDLVQAANDWLNGVIPPGFTAVITLPQLVQLANEWAGG